MYNLGTHFKMDYEKAKTNPNSQIKGNKYRISILTDNLYRFEYNAAGLFKDEPTELVWYRNFEKPEFTINEDNNYISITTKYAQIQYAKDKNFDSGKINPAKNLSVKVLNSDKFWYYHHPEARNIGSPGYNVDQKSISKMKKLSDVKLDKGLYSFDGFVSIDDSKSLLMEEDGTYKENLYNGLDIYLFVYGNDFNKCLKDYYSITGYPSMLPRYALGNWWFKNDTYNDKSIANLVENFRDNKVPLSVITLNEKWHKLPVIKKKETTSGFTFNNEYFTNALALINYLHSQGIKLGLPINPFDGFYDVDDLYEKAKGYLGEDKNGVIPFNVLNPKVVDVYLKLFVHPLDNMKVDFYNLGDYSNLNELAYLKHFEYYDMLRSDEHRPLIMSSNTNLASHRYSIVKSSNTTVDWDCLKLLSLYNVTESNMGLTWWNHDIGGFTGGAEDDELYTRFIELGVFSPILNLSSDSGKYYKREPWKWNIKTNTIAKEFLTLRHKLIPYIYSESYNYSKNGVPLIKPLYYDDEKFYDDEIYYNEYYFGSQLLVSPIIKRKEIVMNRNIQKIYIPDGIWYDFFSGKKFPGGREYVSFYREQDYPVFARAGSIIPMGLNPNINDTNPPKDMEIHIFPGQSNIYHLYEDDGISNLYKKDFYLQTDIDYNYLPNNYTVIIRAVDGKSGIVPDYRNYKIVFRNTKKADDVIVYSNDIKMDYKSYVNGPDFIVEIENAKTTGQISINCKGKDIEIDALRIINNDIENILSDLQIPTVLKEKVDKILFDRDLTISKKRIAIRKLKKFGLEPKFIKLFLKLLEYINQV